jgi:hypothetical protein
VKKVKTFNGCSTSEVSYELADGTNANASAPADESCHVFRAAGGDATPCGTYLETNCDLETLTLGEKCPDADVIYAGTSGGNRLYTTAANQGGVFEWGPASTTGATSTSDGKANTDTLVALGGAYEAATTCRGLGSDWYLPAMDELNKLYTNRAAIGGFAGWYWSSTENNADPYIARSKSFGDGNEYGANKNNNLDVRCVRR